jgi:DNA-binding LacI/PurR family transcriptional regulator
LPRSRVTIRDVAAHAGVSHQTVSRVINKTEGVNPDTRAKVDAAISELGYSPNAVARSMARGRTCMIGCISPNLTDFTFASIIEGAESEARKQDYFLVSSSAADEDSFSELIEQLVGSRRVEGLMIINPYADRRHNLIPKDFPTIYVGAHPREEEVSSISLDDIKAAQVATQHLIDLGHRRIAMVTGPPVEDCTQDRCTGYQNALESAGITYDPDLVIQGDWSATTGHTAVMTLFDSIEIPTAIFAQNDRMAIGALRATRQLGLSVPEEMAVVGVDDMPLASYFDPPLTTMQQDILDIGQKAARMLIQAVENPESPVQHHRVKAELIIRDSTVCP